LYCSFSLSFPCVSFLLSLLFCSVQNFKALFLLALGADFFLFVFPPLFFRGLVVSPKPPSLFFSFFSFFPLFRRCCLIHSFSLVRSHPLLPPPLKRWFFSVSLLSRVLFLVFFLTPFPLPTYKLPCPPPFLPDLIL